jgi:hypothetical protein
MKKQRVIVLTEQDLSDIIGKVLSSTGLSLKDIFGGDSKEKSSSTQTGGKGYPEVGKWESGVTRGPGNQVGVTKWADVVGTNLKRGKSNPLK